MGISIDALMKLKERRESTRDTRDSFPVAERPGFVALKNGEYVVVRVLGNPHEKRETPYDSKLVTLSWCLGVKNKKVKIVWDNDPNWVFSKLYRKVTEYDYDKDSKTRKYRHEKCPIFPIVIKNLGGTFDKGWAPQKIVVSNVLDRANMAEHFSSGKTKLLSKKSFVLQDSDTTYFEDGYPQMLYNKMFDAAIEERAWIDSFDIAILKLERDPYYNVYTFFDKRKLPKEIQQLMSGDPLTPEEEQLCRYDLDQLYKPTSYRVLYHHFGDYFIQADAYFKTKFYDELLEHYNKEAQVSSSEQEGDKDEEKEDIPFDHLSRRKVPAEREKKNVEEAKTLEASPTRKPPISPESDEGFDLAAKTPWRHLGTGKEIPGWLGIAKLTPQEKLFMKIRPSKGEVDYFDLDGTLLVDKVPCSVCGLLIADSARLCPRCGSVFE